MKWILCTVTKQVCLALQLIIILPGTSLANNYHASTVEVFITATNNGLLTCTNNTVTLSAATTGGNAIFTWTGPGGFTASGAIARATVAGAYIVTATGAGEAKTASFTVVQLPAGHATTIWKADFSLPDGTTAVDTGSSQWTSSHTGASTTRFSVLNNEFRVNNSKPGKEGTWSSPVINIAGRQYVNISVDVRSGVDARGSLENDTTAQGDYIRLYYKLDNGPEVLFNELDGNINNNSTLNTTVSGNSLTGATLQVIIRSRASATDEYYYFDNVQLSAISPIEVSAHVAAGQLLTCAHTQVQLSATTNIPNAAYSWSGPNGFSSTLQNPVVNAPGAYLLQVTEPSLGCTAYASTTVEENSVHPGEISINNSGIITCLTGSVTISGSSSSTDVNYKWEGPNGYSSSSSSATVMHGGLYTLTATNTANGCTSSKSTTVAENTTAPIVTIDNNSPISCANPVVTLSANTTTPNASFLWLGPDFVDVAATTTTSGAGIYFLTVTDPVNGCNTTDFTEVTEDYSDCGARKATTASAAKTAEQNVPAAGVSSFTYKAYPNPVVANALIEFTTPQNVLTTISIYNALGVCEKVLFKGMATANRTYQVTIPATQMKAGAYYYIINTGGKAYTGKLVLVK